MKILQICFRPQLPANDGGAIAMFNMTHGFLQSPNIDLTTFVYNTSKHSCDLEIYRSHFGSDKVIFHSIDTKIDPIKALLYLFKSDSYNIERFNDENLKKALINVLEKETFDVIHFEGLYAAPMLEVAKIHNPKAKMVLRSHNIEHRIWERRASTAKSFLTKWYLKYLSERLKEYEDTIMPLFDAIIPITEVDEEYFRSINVKKIFTSNTGLLLDNYPSFTTLTKNSVFHIGSLDWLPNQEAMIWFLDKVWPKVVKEVPKGIFFMAGKNMPNWFKKYRSKNVKILGEVQDAAEFMSSHGIMVVPLLSGSGMRIKIIEGMACSCPIVSTKIGAEGIFCDDGQNIIIADTENEMSKAIIKLLNNQSLAAEIGGKAREKVENFYSNSAKAKDLIEFYIKLCND